MSRRQNIYLQKLIKTSLLDENFSQMLHDAAAQAALICECAIAFVCIMNKEKNEIAACTGFTAQHDFNKSLFTKEIILEPTFFQINNIADDERFNTNTYCINQQPIQFYASVPLISHNNVFLGTLCIMDTSNKTLSKAQTAFIELLAKNIITQLALGKKSAELKKVQELYELIIETNPDIVFAKDKNFKIVHANSAFMSLYPKNAHDKIIGYTTLEDYRPEEADAFLTQDKKAFAEGKSEITETLLSPAGEVRTLFTTKIRFHNNKGEPYIVGVSRDVTERENLIAQLKKSNSDLDEFAYIASHDLKSPLNAIKGLTGWIEEDLAGKIDPDSKTHFDMIKSRVTRMERLLDDLLEYSRIGKKESKIATMNLKEVVEDCYGLIDIPKAFTISSNNLSLTLPKIPLIQVITNLISNAIKHHHKSEGTIHFNGLEKDNHYVITVSDDGPGIAPEYHEKVFARFGKLKPRDEVEGSGLGLSMVKRAVEHYGGHITLTSSEGAGCKFIIQWPRAETAPQ